MFNTIFSIVEFKSTIFLCFQVMLSVHYSLFVIPFNGTRLQYSYLENPMDGGAWWAAVHGVANSWTQLN